MTCFMLLVMGLSPRFLVFFLLELSIVHSALLTVVFCSDFSFFNLLFLCGVFFLYLFIFYCQMLMTKKIEND
jgi:hypothetical protein